MINEISQREEDLDEIITFEMNSSFYEEIIKKEPKYVEEDIDDDELIHYGLTNMEFLELNNSSGDEIKLKKRTQEETRIESLNE